LHDKVLGLTNIEAKLPYVRLRHPSEWYNLFLKVICLANPETIQPDILLWIRCNRTDFQEKMLGQANDDMIQPDVRLWLPCDWDDFERMLPGMTNIEIMHKDIRLWLQSDLTNFQEKMIRLVNDEMIQTDVLRCVFNNRCYHLCSKSNQKRISYITTNFNKKITDYQFGTSNTGKIQIIIRDDHSDELIILPECEEIYSKYLLCITEQNNSFQTVGRGQSGGGQGHDGGGGEQGKSINLAMIPPLQGFIGYETKKYGMYAKYMVNTYVKNGKVYHDSVYLGKVINKERGVFWSRVRGYFKFTLENGFEQVSPEDHPSASTKGLLSSSNSPRSISLDFGDIWMIDSIMKGLKLDSVLENLIPEKANAIKALIGFKLISSKAYCEANGWYSESFAQILYQNAKLDSPRISELHAKLGTEELHRKFFQLYFNNVIKKDSELNKNAIAVIIDSSGLENDINNFLTAVNNHGGKISKEIRITYVVDKDSKIPLFFRISAGNIIDNSLLISTINTLATYGIELEMIIMDAGYSSKSNILDLLSAKIDFITRLCGHTKEYKRLIEENGPELDDIQNAVKYGDRTLYVKKVPISIDDHQLFAYVMQDVDRKRDEEKKIIQNFCNVESQYSRARKNMRYAGKFVLISTKEYSKDEILIVYYTRQSIEQVFDILKNYAGGLPVRGHSTETIRGIILISFISTVIYAELSRKLSNSIYSANTALSLMSRVKINIYGDTNILDDPSKDQKNIFKHLNLEPPFLPESGLKIPGNNPFLKIHYDLKSKRGRPKGSKNSLNLNSLTVTNQDIGEQSIETLNKKGRPKGSKNRPKFNNIINDNHDIVKTIVEVPRKRGRPKGSKNRPKINQQIHMNQNIVDQSKESPRKRGRPKGSKNCPTLDS
jgi:hypothetical protein